MLPISTLPTAVVTESAAVRGGWDDRDSDDDIINLAQDMEDDMALDNRLITDPDNNQYITIQRAEVLSPTITNQLLQQQQQQQQQEETVGRYKEHEDEAGNGDSLQSEGPYVSMAGFSVKAHAGLATNAATTFSVTTATSSTATAMATTESEPVMSDQRNGSISSSRHSYVNHTAEKNRRVSDSDVIFERPYVNQSRSKMTEFLSSIMNDPMLSNDQQLEEEGETESAAGGTPSLYINQGRYKSSLLQSYGETSGASTITTALSSSPNGHAQVDSPPLSLSASHAPKIPSHYDRPRSHRQQLPPPPSSSSPSSSSLLDSPNMSAKLPEPLVPVSTPSNSPEKSSRRFSSGPVITTSSAITALPYSSSSDTARKDDTRALLSSSLTAPIEDRDDSVFGEGKAGAPHVPSSERFFGLNRKEAPKPKPRTRHASEKGVSEYKSTSESLSSFPAKPLPPRNTGTASMRPGQYIPLRVDTIITDQNDYTRLDPKTRLGPGGKIVIPDEQQQIKKMPVSKSFKEKALEEILADDEFAGCEVEICRFALEQLNYSVEKAKVEIRVQILLGMLLPHISEEDCRRALAHCQNKTERAGNWLIQLSSDISSKIQ